MLSVPSSASSLGPAFLRRSPDLRERLPFLKIPPKPRPRIKCSAFATTSPAPATEKSTKIRLRTPKKSKNSKTDSEESEQVKELDYGEVAAALENIYILSPAENFGDDEIRSVVSNRNRRVKRLRLKQRISAKERRKKDEEEEKVEKLVKEYYSAATELSSVDWTKMEIPSALSSAEHTWLFKLMQPMKALHGVKKTLKKDLGREPNEEELAAAVDMSIPELRRRMEVGIAARSKLIKHNLQLVLIAMNKYFPEYSSGEKFQDLCQAGAMGLITAIDCFKPNSGFRLSAYALFWIRHYIVHSMTISSFRKVPFGIESARREIQKAKLQLSVELGRLPTKEEICQRVGISPERDNDVMKASHPVHSLNSKHVVTEKELDNGVANIDGAGANKNRQAALLRLALDDDVLMWLLGENSSIAVEKLATGGNR